MLDRQPVVVPAKEKGKKRKLREKEKRKRQPSACLYWRFYHFSPCCVHIGKKGKGKKNKSTRERLAPTIRPISFLSFISKYVVDEFDGKGRKGKRGEEEKKKRGKRRRGGRPGRDHPVLVSFAGIPLADPTTQNGRKKRSPEGKREGREGRRKPQPRFLRRRRKAARPR